MSLKLIDKELKSKYAEALFKNESSYEKEMDRRVGRLQLDFMRNSHQVDAGSQIFLNRIRQKRSKWIQDDLKYRDYYRLVCRNVHNRKLDNLKSFFEKNATTASELDPANQLRLKLLQDQLRQKEMNLTFYNSEPMLRKRVSNKPPPERRPSELPRRSRPSVVQQTLVLEKTESEFEAPESTQPVSRVPKLPDIKTRRKIGDEFEDLYSRYSKSDREFIEKFPAKVELTLTDVGKQFIDSQKRRHVVFKRNVQNFRRIQENALEDQRFKNLVSYLV